MTAPPAPPRPPLRRSRLPEGAREDGLAGSGGPPSEPPAGGLHEEAPAKDGLPPPPGRPLAGPGGPPSGSLPELLTGGLREGALAENGLVPPPGRPLERPGGSPSGSLPELPAGGLREGALAENGLAPPSERLLAEPGGSPSGPLPEPQAGWRPGLPPEPPPGARPGLPPEPLSTVPRPRLPHPLDLPLLPLSQLLTRLMRSMAARHPAILRRLGHHGGARILLDVSDAPALLLMQPQALRLTAHRRRHPPEADAVIRGRLAAFLAMLHGLEDGDALFFSGQLEIAGDTEAVLALRNALDDAELDLGAEIAAQGGPAGPLLRRLTGLAARLSGLPLSRPPDGPL